MDYLNNEVLTPQEANAAIEKAHSISSSASEIDRLIVGFTKQPLSCNCAVLDYCDSLTEYTTVSGSASADRELTNDLETGKRVLKVTLNADGNHTIQKSTPILNSDIRVNGNFSVKLKVVDVTKVQKFTFILYMKDGSYYQTFVELNPNTPYSSYRNNKWFNLLFSFGELSKAGGAINIEDSTSDIDYIQFGPRICTTGGVMYISEIVMGITHKPKISFSFDDGNASDFLTSRKILDLYNFKASTSIIGNLIGSPNFLNSEQIFDLYANGWDIACHGNISLYDNFTTKEEVITDVQSNLNYIAETGVPRPSMYIYPEGEYFGEAITALEELGFVCAGTVNSTARPLPYINKMVFPRSGTSGKTLTRLKEEVDKVIKDGGYKDFFTHFVANGATGNNTDLTIFKQLISYIAKKVEDGEVDVILSRDYFLGV